MPFSLTITDPEILALLEAYKPDQREAAALKAIKIGLIALKDMETVGNVDYVEKEFQKFRQGLEIELKNLKEEFAKKLEDADKLIQNQLEKNFDSKDGVLPHVLERYLGEGGTLADLFDETQSTSATAKFKSILAEYFDEDASTVVKLLDANNQNSPLYSFKKDLIERLVSIEKEIKAKESAKEATKLEAAKGTQKGFEYEEVVFAELEKVARVFGDTCLPTAKEVGLTLDSKQGDAVVTLNPANTGGATLRIVFEAKDKGMYLNALLDELEGAKKNRGATVAVAVVSGKDTLKDVREAIGVFRDYPGQRTICVLDKEYPDATALEVAYKLARAKLLLSLQTKEMKSEAVDLVAINTLIEEITKKLSEFAGIQSTLTKASTAIDGAKTQIEGMKNELQVKLQELAEKAQPIKKK
ncbi:MAG: hypothetical protein WCV72_02590 [Patescibacteria group bacterium]